MIGRLSRLAAALTRDKADTLLLLGAAVLVLAPHAAHLPAWISALCAAMLLWRGLVTFRGKRMPPNAVLVPLALAAMAGVFRNFHTLLGRDAGVAMLVLLVTFKMLEMRARRDLFVVLYLLFFLVLTNFFYSQAIVTALLMAATIIVLLTAQMTFITMMAVLSAACGLHLEYRLWIFAFPLAKLSALTPATLGGIGVREAALGALLKPFGVAFAMGVAVGLMWETVMVAGGLLAGLIALLAGRSEHKTITAAGKEEASEHPAARMKVSRSK